MGDWESIFKKKGRVFIKPHDDMTMVINLLKKNSARKVLDLGCGTGRHTILLAKKGFDVYGLDISKEGLRQTAESLRKNELKAKLRCGSCYKKFPYKDNTFDAIISVQVIHHNYVKKIRYCISEIERVLKPNGILFVTVAINRARGRTKRFRLAAPRTYIPLDGDEKGLPHYIYNKQLLRRDFKNFNIIKIYNDKKRIYHDRKRHYCLIGKLR